MIVRAYTRFFILGVVILALLGCKSEREARLYDDAVKNVKSSDLQSALKNLDLIIITKPESPYAIKAAHLGTDISEQKPEYKNYFIKFSKFIILNSNSEPEQINYQTKITQSLFESGDYGNAIVELQKTLSKPGRLEGRFELLLLLAKSYYFLRNFEQAQVEVKKVINESPQVESKFQGKILMTNILSSQKKFKEAQELLKKLKEENPDLYKKNDLELNVALLYEEMEEFDKAIDVLKTLDKTKLGKKFIEEKIERLESRKELLPGAQGLSR